MSDFDIVHSEQQKMFSISFDDDQKAYIKYRYIEPAKVDFFTTFVPPAHRAKGLAALLVEHAFAWAEQQSLAIETSCWYAAKKMAQHNTK